MKNLIVESFWQVLKYLIELRAESDYFDGDEQDDQPNLTDDEQKEIVVEMKPYVHKCAEWFADLYSDKVSDKDKAKQTKKLREGFIKVHVTTYPSILKNYPQQPLPAILYQ